MNFKRRHFWRISTYPAKGYWAIHLFILGRLISFSIARADERTG